MTAWQQRAVACLRRLPKTPNPKMAEIGIGYGRMARELIRARADLQMVWVDNYLPMEEQPRAYVKTGDTFARRDVQDAAQYALATQQLAEATGDRVTFLLMSSGMAAGKVDNGTLDLVFIDADHSYEGCSKDIAMWGPKVKPGGWIGGHDYHNHDRRFDFTGVDRAVDEFVAKTGRTLMLDQNFTWWVQL